MQIDGVLNIENGGEVFIPSGATFSDLDTQLALKAPLVSPAFTGTPTAPTQAAQDNSTKVATTAYVDGKMVLGTAVTATGTSIDFTGLPPWVKKIKVMFSAVSTNGTSAFSVQLGSGIVATTGYVGCTSQGTISSNFSAGFSVVSPSVATTLYYGTVKLENITGNIWIESASIGNNNSTYPVMLSNGSITLSAALDRIRITTVNGTDAFDAGQINIMYEG